LFECKKSLLLRPLKTTSLKIIISLTLILTFTLSSCKTSKYVFTPIENSNKVLLPIKWESYSGNWKIENGIITGTKNGDDWAIIRTHKKLPKSYEIKLEAMIIYGEIIEVMPNFNDQTYIRSYLYEIEQNMTIGLGEFQPGYFLGTTGGITLKDKSLEVKLNKWYTIKIRVDGDNYSYIVNDSKELKASFSKSKLSNYGHLGLSTNGSIKIKNITIKKL